MKIKHIERGQALIVIALALVGLMGIAGLVNAAMLMMAATDARFFRRAGQTAYGFGLFSRHLSLEDYGVMFHGDDERVEAAVAGTRLTAGAGGREASDRGVLERLRVMAQREAVSGEQFLGDDFIQDGLFVLGPAENAAQRVAVRPVALRGGLADHRDLHSSAIARLKAAAAQERRDLPARMACDDHRPRTGRGRTRGYYLMANTLLMPKATAVWLVDNTALCQLFPAKKNSCNEMDGVRLQAQRLHELERYVDAQSGGPGRGWFRIVTDPFEARRAINAGKLAVVMGIEVSKLFNCGVQDGQPECTARVSQATNAFASVMSVSALMPLRNAIISLIGVAP